MKSYLSFVLMAAGVIFAGNQHLRAQSSDELKKEIEAIKEDHAAIRKELKEIRQLLTARQPAAPEPFKPTEIDLRDSPALGRTDAKVTLVEFTDYQCPFCARHAKGVLPQIVEHYVDSGKLRYVLREYPLTRIHPQAAKASEAALCAGDQEKYWEMHGKIFSNQQKLAEQDLAAHAEMLGLDLPRFKSCLEQGKYEQKVQADLEDGAMSGVRGTPSFFLGLTDPNDPNKVVATEFLRGALPYRSFQRAIDGLLSSKQQNVDAASE